MKYARPLSLALLALCGCAGFQGTATRCPWCGWLIQPLGAWTYHTDLGTYKVIDYYCASWTCAWSGSVTNWTTPK